RFRSVRQERDEKQVKARDKKKRAKSGATGQGRAVSLHRQLGSYLRFEKIPLAGRLCRGDYWPTRRGVGDRLQKMSKLRLFGLEILLVVRVGQRPNRYLLDHLQTVPFQTDDFLGIVREEAKLPHTQIDETLRPETVI